jgi:HK97 family phage major capsid protein
MTGTQTLLDQRANVWSQLNELDNRPKDPTTGVMKAEDREQWDRLDALFDSLTAEIERDAKHTQRANALGQVDRTGVMPAAGVNLPGGGDPEHPAATAYADAFNAYIRNIPMSPEQTRALQGGFDPETVKAAAGVGTGAAGGYLVPPEFRQTLIEQTTFVAAMRQFAEVITTETGANLPWPTVDETGQEGAILGENTQISEQDVTFGQASLDAYMYTSKLVRVSFQLLNDNAFNLNSWLPRALGQRIGRIQNRHFTVGTGSSQPDGIITSATVGVTLGAGNTTTITYDGLIDLIDSIDPSYINNNSRFMLAQATRKVLRKLKDSQNRPLWEPSLQVGAPDNLLGYPVALNNYMATPAANAKTVLFGDISAAYVIRDVSDVAVMRLVERYADFLQVGFFAFQRSDGTLQNASAAKVLQQSAT